MLPVAAKQTKRESLDDADKKVIAHARKLIDEAIVIRPEWNVLWRVRGEIEQFEKNIDGAIASYQRAWNTIARARPAFGSGSCNCCT